MRKAWICQLDHASFTTYEWLCREHALAKRAQVGERGQLVWLSVKQLLGKDGRPMVAQRCAACVAEEQSRDAGCPSRPPSVEATPPVQQSKQAVTSNQAAVAKRGDDPAKAVRKSDVIGVHRQCRDVAGIHETNEPGADLNTAIP